MSVGFIDDKEKIAFLIREVILRNEDIDNFKRDSLSQLLYKSQDKDGNNLGIEDLSATLHRWREGEKAYGDLFQKKQNSLRQLRYILNISEKQAYMIVDYFSDEKEGMKNALSRLPLSESTPLFLALAFVATLTLDFSSNLLMLFHVLFSSGMLL